MPTSRARAPHQRRTQSSRREGTRAKLLNAVLSGLSEVGYARLTTTEVGKRAGVSQGALFKHFATKADLMAAAADHLFQQNVVAFRQVMDGLASAEDRLGAAFDALWFAFITPHMQATFELFVAARTDPDLAAHLQPMVASHRDLLAQLARELFADVAHLPYFDEHIRMMLDAMQGAAVERPVMPDDARRDRMLGYLRELSRSFVTASTLPPSSD